MKYTVVSSDEFPQPANPTAAEQYTPTTPTQLSYSQSQNSHNHHYAHSNSFSNSNHNRTVSAATSTYSHNHSNHIVSPTYPPPRPSGESLNHSPPPTSAPPPPPTQPVGPPPLPPKTPLPYPDDEPSPVSATTQPSPMLGNGPATFTNMGDLRRTLPYPVSGVDQDGYGQYGGGFGDEGAPPPSVNMRSKPTISR